MATFRIVSIVDGRGFMTNRGLRWQGRHVRMNPDLLGVDMRAELIEVGKVRAILTTDLVSVDWIEPGRRVAFTTRTGNTYLIVKTEDDAE